MSAIELDDVQGGLLAAHGLAHAAYLSLRVADAAEGRRTLSALLDDVPSAAPRTGAKPPLALNVGVSWRGLGRLGVGDAVLAGFPAEFRAGMAARAELLGDTGPSAPAGWDPGLRDGEVDVLVTVSASDAALRDARAGELVDGLGPGVACTQREDAALLEGAREHFGFADGFSQPVLDDPVAGPTRRPGQGTPHPRVGWVPIAPGEMVLGYEDADGVVAPVPGGALGRNGTYLVARKLRQHVARFWGALREAADGDPARTELLAAKAVGRWRDGTPLALSPEGPDPRLAADPALLNAFGYRNDPRGLRCPLGAHVRRSNPRDGLLGDGRLTRGHRIMRRGMPYGPPPADRFTDDGVDRGLVFVCAQASIEHGFETIQASWCLDGDLFGLGAEQDPLLGGGHPQARFRVPGAPPAFVHPRPAVVETRGGEYLLAPGLRALRELAAAPGR